MTEAKMMHQSLQQPTEAKPSDIQVLASNEKEMISQIQSKITTVQGEDLSQTYGLQQTTAQSSYMDS